MTKQPVEKNEEGATMVEYALMIALLAVALMSAVTALKGGVSRSFSKSSSALT